MSSVEEAARRRREKILARQEQRNQLLSGGRTADEPPSDPTAPVVEATDKADKADEVQAQVEADTQKDDRPIWEKKYERNLASAPAQREIPASFLDKLDVTDSMAVHAPKAQGEQFTSPIVLEEPRFSVQLNYSSEGLLTCAAVTAIGVLSGMTNGDFIVENLYLPMGRMLAFILMLRVLSSVTLGRLGLAGIDRSKAELPWLVNMGLKFLPPQVGDAVTQISKILGFVKNSTDDLLLFVFIHGITSSLLHLN